MFNPLFTVADMLSQAHTHVLILGSGPAGLAAAQAAGRSGQSVTLVDDNCRAGGQIWRARPGQPSLAATLESALAQLPNVRTRLGTRCVMVTGSHQVLLENDEGGWLQTFDRLIICSGARELLLPFPGWTLPGVTGAGGLQALIKSGVPVKGQRVVIAGSGPLLLASARTATQAGATLVRVAEQARAASLISAAMGLWRWPGKLKQAALLATPAFRTGCQVLEALGTHKVEGVRIQQGKRVTTLACDRIACGYGLTPNTEVARALGLPLGANQGIAVDEAQQSALPHVFAAGECTGIGGAEKALIEGEIAGLAATDQWDRARQRVTERAHWHAFATHMQHAWPVDPSAVRAVLKPDTLVCRCEDVSASDVSRHTHWIEAKLHTRCGMGPCQGRVCGTVTAALWGWQQPPARPLVQPCRIGSIAGLHASEVAPSAPMGS